MFNVNRTYPAPECLQRKKYREAEVVDRLKEMFFDKCYLCERDNIQDVEIEHLIPHGGNDILKYDWDNLFYACRRCNSIKSDSHIGILDCTKEQTEIWKLIKCIVPSAPNRNIHVECYDTSKSSYLLSTILLLDECYNSTNTALREISRENLIEQIFTHYILLLEFRKELLDKSTGDTRKKEVKECILNMINPKYPFSIFWIHYCIEDTLLLKNHNELSEALK